MSFLRLAVAVVAVLYVAAFAMSNTEPAPLDLLFVDVGELPVALLVLASVCTGASIASLGLAWPMFHGRVQQRRDARRIEELEREIHGLRTLPLSEDDLDPAQAPER